MRAMRDATSRRTTSSTASPSHQTPPRCVSAPRTAVPAPTDLPSDRTLTDAVLSLQAIVHLLAPASARFASRRSPDRRSIDLRVSGESDHHEDISILVKRTVLHSAIFRKAYVEGLWRLEWALDVAPSDELVPSSP